MENKHLIDLSVKYGLSGTDISKLASLVHQVGVTDPHSSEFGKIAAYICENKMIDRPAEELVEDLKLKGLIR